MRIAGSVARQYALGQRRAFSNPFKFFLLAIAVNVLIINVLGFDIFKGVVPQPTGTDVNNPIVQTVNDALHVTLTLSK